MSKSEPISLIHRLHNQYVDNWSGLYNTIVRMTLFSQLLHFNFTLKAALIFLIEEVAASTILVPEVVSQRVITYVRISRSSGREPLPRPSLFLYFFTMVKSNQKLNAITKNGSFVSKKYKNHFSTSGAVE